MSNLAMTHVLAPHNVCMGLEHNITISLCSVHLPSRHVEAAYMYANITDSHNITVPIAHDKSYIVEKAVLISFGKHWKKY